ncbi:hypothetical protein EV175_002348 [Coemansia sp. RSA 1933]|nr:hypothetical protein EV175_002348 [Coemansia sp. RSA 1933]
MELRDAAGTTLTTTEEGVAASGVAAVEDAETPTTTLMGEGQHNRFRSVKDTHIQNPPQYRPRPVPSSGTVLAAEPQVRDLKKELTTLVPSAIARKNKQSDRQRVLEAVPLAPQMVINAAPDVGIDPAGPVATASSRNNTATSTSIIENIQPLAGMSFNAAPDLSKSEPGPPKKEGSNKSKPDSLDDQYQKFVSQMDNLL